MHKRISVGNWEAVSWRQFVENMKTLARAFIASGISERAGYLIMGYNSPEWVTCFGAGIFNNGISGGVYTSNATHLCKYQCEISRSQVVCVENTEYCNRFLSVKSELPLLKLIVQWDGKISDEARAAGVISYDELVARGKDPEGTLQKELDARMARCKPGQCCALVFTSGTTGYPSMLCLAFFQVFYY